MAAPRYEVLPPIVETAEPTPTGQLQQVTVIRLRIPASGQIGTVRIPKHNVTPEEAKTALDAEAARLEAIRQLGS